MQPGTCLCLGLREQQGWILASNCYNGPNYNNTPLPPLTHKGHNDGGLEMVTKPCKYALSNSEIFQQFSMEGIPSMLVRIEDCVLDIKYFYLIDVAIL